MPFMTHSRLYSSVVQPIFPKGIAAGAATATLPPPHNNSMGPPLLTLLIYAATNCLFIFVTFPLCGTRARRNYVLKSDLGILFVKNKNNPSLGKSTEVPAYDYSSSIEQFG